MARGQQAVGIAVATPAEEFYLLRQRRVALLPLPGEHQRRGRIHVGVCEVGAGARLDRLAVEGRALARDAQPAFLEDRLVDDAKYRLAVMQQRDQRTEDRQAGDE